MAQLEQMVSTKLKKFRIKIKNNIIAFHLANPLLVDKTISDPERSAVNASCLNLKLKIIHKTILKPK